MLGKGWDKGGGGEQGLGGCVGVYRRLRVGGCTGNVRCQEHGITWSRERG